MEGGCLREFTRFLEKEVHAAPPHMHHLPFRIHELCHSQDPVHKWADLQRALLTEGHSVWCCKDCIGIIKDNKDATYQEIRVKVDAAAEPLPEVTGVLAASTVPTARESTDHSQPVDFPFEATPALAAMVAKGEANAEAEAKKASAGVASKGKSINGRGPRRSALIKRIFSKTGRMRKRGPSAADHSQSNDQTERRSSWATS